MKSLTRFFTLFVVCACSTAALANDVVPGAPQKEPIALVGGTVHPVVGPVVENGTILFEAGKLTAVGRDVALPTNVRKIDVRGKHVYPGMIDVDTEIGLVEIQAVRATVDDAESGDINPNCASRHRLQSR